MYSTALWELWYTWVVFVLKIHVTSSCSWLKLRSCESKRRRPFQRHHLLLLDVIICSTEWKNWQLEKLPLKDPTFSSLWVYPIIIEGGVALHDIIWHHPWFFSKGNPNQDRPWKMTVGRLNFPFGIAKFSGSTLNFQGVFTQNLKLARSFGFPAIDLRCWSSWATQSRAEQWKVLFSFSLGSCTSQVDEYYSLGKSVKVPSMWRFMTHQEYIKKHQKPLSKLKGRGKLKVDLLEGGWHCIPYPLNFPGLPCLPPWVSSRSGA